MTAKSGNKTWTIPGIYKLTEVVLVLCFGHWPTAIDPPDKELKRPARFETTDKQTAVLLRLQKQ